MTQVILDANAISKLNSYGQPVEVCDTSGRVLGRFVPKFDPAEWEIVGPEASEEELRRREQSDAWYTTDEVLAHLKSLESQ